MQAIRDQQLNDRREKERTREEAMKKAADLEDEQRREDLHRTAQPNVRKPQVASFRPPVPTAAEHVDAEIGPALTKDSTSRKSIGFIITEIQDSLSFRACSSDQK
jgi:hypothetical protein